MTIKSSKMAQQVNILAARAKDLSLIVGCLIQISYICPLFSTNLNTRPPMAAQWTSLSVKETANPHCHPGASSVCLTHIKSVCTLKLYFQIQSQLIIPSTLSSSRSLLNFSFDYVIDITIFPVTLLATTWILRVILLILKS